MYSGLGVQYPDMLLSKDNKHVSGHYGILGPYGGVGTRSQHGEWSDKMNITGLEDLEQICWQFHCCKGFRFSVIMDSSLCFLIINVLWITFISEDLSICDLLFL